MNDFGDDDMHDPEDYDMHEPEDYENYSNDENENSTEIKKTKKRRNPWGEVETREFLKLLRENKIIKKLDGKEHRKLPSYEKLVPLMKEKGYTRSAKQMIDKYSNLRSKFNYSLKIFSNLN